MIPLLKTTIKQTSTINPLQCLIRNTLGRKFTLEPASTIPMNVRSFASDSKNKAEGEPNKLISQRISGDYKGKIKDRWKTGLMIAGIGGTIAAAGYYKNNKYKIQKKCLQVAEKHSINLPLLVFSREELYEELFFSAGKDLKRARFLIEAMDLNVNIINKYSETLLEEFYPHNETELNEYIDFVNFVIKKGYWHLNRNIGGKEDSVNLITNVYNRHIFEDQPVLRQKLIGFWLEKGVNPLHKSKYLGTGLSHAFFEGDGAFFLETCKRLNISLHLEDMEPMDAYSLFQATILGPNPADIVILLNSGVKVGPNKNKLIDMLAVYASKIGPQLKKTLSDVIKNHQDAPINKTIPNSVEMYWSPRW